MLPSHVIHEVFTPKEYDQDVEYYLDRRWMGECRTYAFGRRYELNDLEHLMRDVTTYLAMVGAVNAPVIAYLISDIERKTQYPDEIERAYQWRDGLIHLYMDTALEPGKVYINIDTIKRPYTASARKPEA